MNLIFSLICTLGYFVLFVPVSLVLRMFRPDRLRIEKMPGQSTYWVDRPGQRYSDMTRQK